jgi:hypothetical protein
VKNHNLLEHHRTGQDTLGLRKSARKLFVNSVVQSSVREAKNRYLNPPYKPHRHDDYVIARRTIWHGEGGKRRGLGLVRFKSQALTTFSTFRCGRKQGLLPLSVSEKTAICSSGEHKRHKLAGLCSNTEERENSKWRKVNATTEAEARRRQYSRTEEPSRLESSSAGPRCFSRAIAFRRALSPPSLSSVVVPSLPCACAATFFRHFIPFEILSI